MNPSPVLQPLATLAANRRRHARGIVFAVSFALLVAAVALVALADTWFEWRPPVRVALVVALLGGFAVVMSIRLRAARRHDPMEAARAVESAHPEMGQKLRTALEISGNKSPARPVTDYFANRLMRETGRELLQVRWSGLVPSKRLWRSRAVAFGAVLAVAILATGWGDFRHAMKRIAQPHRALTYTTIEWASLPSGFDDAHPPRLEFTIRGRDAQPHLLVSHGGSEWQPVELTRRGDGRTWDVIFTGKTRDLHVKVLAGDAAVDEKTLVYRPVPKLAEASATIAWPDYTGLEPETVAGGDVRCVEGSTVTWQFTFDFPPARATWSVAGSGPVELSAATGKGTLEVSADVEAGRKQAELAIFHSDGERLDAWRFEIDGVVDKLPVVEIVEPDKDLELIPTAQIPVRIRATDDFGISEIGLILDAGGERRWLLETTIDAKNQRQAGEIATLMLDVIALGITDNVRIHAYALDHKPRGGPRAVSALRAVDIRQFQMRWYWGGGGDGGGDEGPDSESVSDALMRLDQIIGAQRGIVSDVFGAKESHRGTLTPEAVSRATESADREQALAEESQRVALTWEMDGQLPADDIVLMATAAEQMAEAAGFLLAPNLAKGFDTGDRALSTLLQLRKELLTILGRGKKPSEPKDKPPVPLADLAKEARRIAGEERDVASRIEPDAIAGNPLSAIRRQHEVVLADTGELYANLVDHHERTEGALRLMDEAEKAVATADRTLNGDAPENAGPELAEAERDLLDLAVFLESMDLQRLSETLRQLADNAEKAAGEQKAAGEGEAPSPSAEPSAAAARSTGLAGSILDELAQQAEAARADPEAPKSPAEAALERLRERVDAAGLAEDLEELARREESGAVPGDLRADAAGRLGAMARELREAAAALDASLLAELNQAREQAAALKQDLAKKGGPGSQPGAEGEGEGTAEAEGEKPGGQSGGGDDGPGPGGPVLGRFADTLDRLGDEGGLGRMVMPLRAAPFDRSTIPLVDAADRRLAELIEQIPVASGIAAARDRLPEESRREIEDYFRALSDDFGDEVWEAN